MRFATAILAFSEKKGGAERYLVDLCRRMAAEGHEVHVYAGEWDREIPGVRCHRVKTLPFPKSLRLLSFAIRASKAMERGQYDATLGVGTILKAGVIQPHGGVHWAWFWRSLKAYKNPSLRILKLLGRVFSLKQWTAGWIEGRPYKRGDFSRIVAISDMVKRDLIRWYGIPEEKIAVVYNGVDLDRFHPRNRRYREEIRERHGIGRERVILFVSNNFRMKGLRFLMMALARMKRDGTSPVKLLILGRDREAPYVRLAKRFGLSGEVIFAGSTDEPEKYYGAADLLVHPTFYDACSLTVLEAMASGLPVITTVYNGAGGALTTGQEGAVLPDPGDVRVLAEKVSEILEPAAAARASMAARRASEAHSIGNNWREMLKIFQDHGREGASKE